MQNILITGSNGQLGLEFQQIALTNLAYKFIFVDINQLNITDKEAVTKFFNENVVNYCINCAAYTAVDKAEEEKVIAIEVNANGPKILSAACKQVGATFIQISTDFVFDGKINTPYKESHYARPLSIYGKSKRKGEVEALVENPKAIIIRTSWLYSAYGSNFVKTMQRLGKERTSLGVVYDQVGAPTYANDLAQAIIQIIDALEEKTEKDIFGIYHFSNTGISSWYDFAVAIFDLSGIQIKVNPILTEDYPLPAKRPAYSVLNASKVREKFNMNIPHWRESLKVCIKKLKENA